MSVLTYENQGRCRIVLRVENIVHTFQLMELKTN